MSRKRLYRSGRILKSIRGMFMKKRIKQLLLRGSLITIVTTVLTIAVALFSRQQFSMIKLSNILFVEFLVIFILASMMLLKNQISFKKQNSVKERQGQEEEKRLHSSIELLIISLPLLIVSSLIVIAN
jgi:Ca2+/Na+ antiporter